MHSTDRKPRALVRAVVLSLAICSGVLAATSEIAQAKPAGHLAQASANTKEKIWDVLFGDPIGGDNVQYPGSSTFIRSSNLRWTPVAQEWTPFAMSLPVLPKTTPKTPFSWLAFAIRGWR